MRQRIHIRRQARKWSYIVVTILCGISCRIDHAILSSVVVYAETTVETKPVPLEDVTESSNSANMTSATTNLDRKLSVETTNMHLHPSSETTFMNILWLAAKRGLGGGISGALAGVVQVFSLMWLRTLINYQCRYGTTFSQALHTLLQEGGIARLYRGLSFAIIQAPLARFVSTAANEGVVAFLASFSMTRQWGPGRTTIVAACVVGAWRMLLMPIDTMKTVLQVDSSEGFRSLMRRVKGGRFMVLYEGALANALAAIVAHYPWFYTFNWLNKSKWIYSLLPFAIVRNAAIGLTASVVSDVVVNAIRVVKTTKQSMGSRQSVTYAEVIRVILAADGWKGLFGRGLRTRIFANALQSIVFTIVWRALAERFSSKRQRSQDEGSTTI